MYICIFTALCEAHLLLFHVFEAGLSGGERQGLVLARLLLRRNICIYVCVCKHTALCEPHFAPL